MELSVFIYCRYQVKPGFSATNLINSLSVTRGNRYKLKQKYVHYNLSFLLTIE